MLTEMLGEFCGGFWIVWSGAICSSYVKDLKFAICFWLNSGCTGAEEFDADADEGFIFADLGAACIDEAEFLKFGGKNDDSGGDGSGRWRGDGGDNGGDDGFDWIALSTVDFEKCDEHVMFHHQL